MIKNKCSGKYYIGQSKDIDRRFNEHKYYLQKGNHKNFHLQNAFNKYGYDSFTFEVIKECSEDVLDDFEEFYIFEYDTYRNGYNLTAGGKLDKYRGHPFNNPLVKERYSEKRCNLFNSTGFYRVSVSKKKDNCTGFAYVYSYRLNGKRYRIQSASIKELERKVKTKGLLWKILDNELAYKTLKDNEKVLEKFPDFKFKNHLNDTGFYHVSKKYNSDQYKQGFIWLYKYYEDGYEKSISRVLLNDLEEEVIKRGLTWRILDTVKADESISLNEKNKKIFYKHGRSHNTFTGFYNVRKVKHDGVKQGFVWRYYYFKSGKRGSFNSIDFFKLKDKVLSEGLEWKVSDNALAESTLSDLN